MKKLLVICTMGLLFLPCLLSSQENNSIACADGIDNDNDGQIDCMDEDCAELPNDGCLICSDGWSFADTLLEYLPGCPLVDPDPTGALGVSDYTGAVVDEPEFVFLGQGGVLKLGFTNNLLTNSADAEPDLWVFEIGPGVEACDLALRPFDAFTATQMQTLGIPDANEDGYFEIGSIGGSTSGVDLDSIMPGFAAGTLVFDAIAITDVLDDTCWGGTPGADIDAVCALRSIPLDTNEAAVFSNSFSVFPNPFHDKISIRYTGLQPESEFTCLVFDVQGRIVASRRFYSSLELDLEDQPAGMYHLSIRSEKGVFQKKVIKAD